MSDQSTNNDKENCRSLGANGLVKLFQVSSSSAHAIVTSSTRLLTFDSHVPRPSKESGQIPALYIDER